MISFSNEEKAIILEYIEEMLEIFNTELKDDFQKGENPSIICNGNRFFKKDFESLKKKVGELD